MKRLAILTAVMCMSWGFVDSAAAEPVWGANCLSCHNVMLERSDRRARQTTGRWILTRAGPEPPIAECCNFSRRRRV